MSTGPIDRRSFLLVAGSQWVLATRAVTHPPTRPAKRPSAPPIRGQVLRPGSPTYDGTAPGYNKTYASVRPALIALPLDLADVRTAVSWAYDRGMRLRARSGGHSYAGYSSVSGGIVVDLRQLGHITADPRTRTARIGAGAQLVDVYAELAAQGFTIPAGSCPSVGVGGHALGGGFGLAARRLGLATDSIVGARLVTADGSVVDVSQHAHPDLFWALRGGGGGNFGVVTSFVFRIHPVPSSVSSFTVAWPWSQADDALDAWQSWAPHATRDITSVFHLDSSGGYPSVSVSGQYFGRSADLPHLLAPILVGGANPGYSDWGYLEAQLYFAGCAGVPLQACHTVGTRPGGALPREAFQAKSTYVSRPLPQPARAVLTDAIERVEHGTTAAILCDSYGGAVSDLAPHATAFVHRDVLFCIQYLSYPSGQPWLQSVTSQMRPYVTGGAYVNYIDPTLADYQQAYYGANLPRLLRVRREIDPHHFFDFPQAI